MTSKVIPGIFIIRPHLAYQFDLVKKYKHYAEIDAKPFNDIIGYLLIGFWENNASLSLVGLA